MCVPGTWARHRDLKHVCLFFLMVEGLSSGSSPGSCPDELGGPGGGVGGESSIQRKAMTSPKMVLVHQETAVTHFSRYKIVSGHGGEEGARRRPWSDAHKVWDTHSPVTCPESTGSARGNPVLGRHSKAVSEGRTVILVGRAEGCSASSNAQNSLHEKLSTLSVSVSLSLVTKWCPAPRPHGL